MAIGDGEKSRTGPGRVLRPERPLDADPRDRIIELALALAPREVLELECGDGAHSKRLQQALGSDVLAVERSPWRVELARARGVCAGVADPAALPFRDGSFDCVIARRMNYPAGPLEDVLYEASRVLRTTGALLARASRSRGACAAEPGDDDGLTREAGAMRLSRYFTTVELYESDGGGADAVFLAKL